MAKAVAQAAASGFKEGCLGMSGIVAFALVWKVTSFLAALGVAAGVFVLAVVLGIRASKRRDAEAAAARAARLAELVQRFGEEAAYRIVAGEYWQGATFQMVEESLGQPVDTKESVYKAKTKTTYLYRQLTEQRYGLKVHFENGIVVGWDD
jgi:hypothetical protein